MHLYPRLDAIATDAELEDKPAEDLNRLADILHNGCLRAVEEYEEKLKEDANFDGERLIQCCYAVYDPCILHFLYVAPTPSYQG